MRRVIVVDNELQKKNTDSMVSLEPSWWCRRGPSKVDHPWLRPGRVCRDDTNGYRRGVTKRLSGIRFARRIRHRFQSGQYGSCNWRRFHTDSCLRLLFKKSLLCCFGCRSQDAVARVFCSNESGVPPANACIAATLGCEMALAHGDIHLHPAFR